MSAPCKNRWLLFLAALFSLDAHSQLDSISASQYAILVDTEVVSSSQCAVGGSDSELLVHRIYVEPVDSADRLYSVFGNGEMPLVILAPGGVYNDPFNSSWNAIGVNSLLFPFFPCLEYDSFATINLESAESSFFPGWEHPGLNQGNSLAQTVSDFFIVNTLGQSVELSVSSDPGASWFLSTTAPNSMPGENGLWLVAQVTSFDHISGNLNFTLAPLGDEQNQVALSREFNSGGCALDETACNYNPNVLFGEDCDYSCWTCPDPNACNFEAGDHLDVDVCDYSCCPGPGCCGTGTVWDHQTQRCQATHLHDFDLDGCVGLADLLDILSQYGNCTEG